MTTARALKLEIPPDVIERDLNRLMGFGVLKEWESHRRRGHRSYVLRFAGEDDAAITVGPLPTYMFIKGAMMMADEWRRSR